ncbi:LamG domain-containing protein [Lentzea sp. NPDC058436]|uniref:LamG domain-containing protein n=1 Tax=Lentzea sp. NPDC058436 TaxID=3346499 RepID=UPI00365D3F8D
MTTGDAGRRQTWPSDDCNGITLIDPVSVSVQGTIVLFAREAGRPADFLYYNVRPVDAEPGVTSQWAGWRALAMAEPVSGADAQPLLRLGGGSLVTVTPEVTLLSPADAPFRVVADDRYLVCFRQSASGSLYVDRFVLVQAPLDQEEARAGDSTVLVLERAWETRYRRSENRDVPAGSGDALGATNMTGEPFLEPTVELPVTGVADGRFDVALAPTGTSGMRWHLAVVDDREVTCLSYPQDSTGRVDVSPWTAESFTLVPAAALPRKAIGDLSPFAGVSLSCYEQQETTRMPDGTAGSVRRGVRLALAVPVRGTTTGLPSALAVYDFPVLQGGTVPPLPSDTPLVLIDGTVKDGKFVPGRVTDGYPIPEQAVHTVDAAPVTAVLLGQPRPSATPALLNGADGLLHCYFAGPADNAGLGSFLVAQMDPAVTRATAVLPWHTASGRKGEVQFVARQPGSTLNGLTVRVGDTPDQPDLCTIRVDYGPAAGLPTETWSGVPRDLTTMSAILGGGSSGDPGDPAVQSGAAPFYDLTGTLAQARLRTVHGESDALLTLVSHRPDVPLTGVRVSGVDDPERVTLAVTYALPGGTEVVQTWPEVPARVGEAAVVLDGDASPTTYLYRGGSGDNPIYALATDMGSVLLFARSAEPVTLTVTAPSHGVNGRCDLVVETSSGVTTLADVSREQSAVVAALLGSPEVSALFAHVSADPCPGSVSDQVCAAPVDLRAGSVLFDVARPLPDGGMLATGAVAAAVLQGRVLDRGTDTGRALLGVTVGAITVPLLGEEALLDNATSTLSTVGGNGRWLAAKVPSALSLNGKNAMSVIDPGPQLAPAQGTTVEAWAAPADGTAACVISYNHGEATDLGGIVPSYYLGTVSMPTLRFSAFTPGGPYAGSYVLVPAQTFFAPAVNQGFTWEAWIRPDDRPGPDAKRFGCVLQVQDTDNRAISQCELFLDDSRRLTFGYRSEAQRQQTLTAPNPLPGQQWAHVAVTGTQLDTDRNTAHYRLTLYVDGVAVATADNAPLYAGPTRAPILCLGANDLENVTLFGCLSEVRYWSEARTAPELRRTMDTSLTGDETNLVGYWPLNEDPATKKFANHAVRTGALLDGTLAGSIAGQPVSSFDAGEFVNLVAGVGGADPLLARGFMRGDRWHHLAVTYQAAGGLRLNPDGLTGATPDFGACDPEGIDFDRQATVEAWIQTTTAGALDQTILARWGTQPSDQAFQLGVSHADGTAYCALTLDDTATGKLAVLRAGHPARVNDGLPHHVAAVYQVTQLTDVNAVVCSLVVYVDGQPGQPQTLQFLSSEVVTTVSSGQPLTLGISALPTTPGRQVALESQTPFQGLLTGVRFSSVAYTAAQVAAAMAAGPGYDDAGGVVSEWWFGEQSGTSAADSVSDNDFELSDSDMWATFASISRYAFYCDGVRIGLVSPAPAGSVVGYRGAPQCTLGAYLGDSGVVQGFGGELAEVRVWAAARTAEQVQDTMYRPLTGSEPGLSAYWPLDGDYTDRTGQGATGRPVGETPKPAFVPSGAPVANEGPQIRNVYGGPVTTFQQPASARPAVVEYADSDVHADGTPAAVMRRAYFTCAPALAAYTGYGLGEMVLTHLGQVQTKPTLIGFIEGAPPVPSENLTKPTYTSNSYFDASSVQLVQTDTTAFSFTSSDYRTRVTMNLDAKVGVKVEWSEYLLFTISGAEWSMADGKLKLQAHEKTSLSLAAQHDEGYVSSWIRTVTDTLGLRGSWEPADAPLNRDVGRRYRPHNTGYALVESLTADLYAMRLRSTGAMVGKLVVPDLDIPPDRNVLLFRIRPDYVKNGTLDGKVGMVDDPDHPGADTQRGSYFKPREAYRLADRIEKSEQNLRAYSAQLDERSLGQDGPGSPDLSEQASEQFYDFETGVATRGIANRYVWTAGGGLHTETESFSSVHENSYSGLYSLSHSTGLAAETEFTGMAVGPIGGVDLLFGGDVKISVGKKQSDTRAVALNVTNATDPMLQAYDPKTGAYSSEPAPGKVDAYRFMSFYLPPSADNGTAFQSDVVDQQWLRFSSDPNAIALRNLTPQANGVWRVLHRVTYVSRVPPTFDTNPAQTVAPVQELAIDVEDNAFLIGLVEQALGKAVPTAANVGAAVGAVLAPADGSPSVLGELVPWWAAFLKRVRGEQPDPADVEALDELLAAAMRYFQAGYAGGALPVR